MFISDRHISNVLIVFALLFSLLNIVVKSFSESDVFWLFVFVFILGLSFSFIYEWWKRRTVVQFCSAIVSDITLISSEEQFYSRFDSMNNKLPEIIVRRIPEPELFDFRPYHFTIASLITPNNSHTILVSGHILNFFHDKEALTFILAHELAHLYLGHAEHVKNRYPNGIIFSLHKEIAELEKQTLRDMEFDADQWAVEVITSMNIPKNAIHRAFHFVERELYGFSKVVDVSYYPSIRERIEAINGYNT